VVMAPVLALTRHGKNLVMV